MGFESIAGEIVTRFVADSSDLMDTFSKITDYFQNFGNQSATAQVDIKAVGGAFMAAGAAGVAAFGTMAGMSALRTDDMRKLAARTGATGEAFDKLKNTIRDIELSGFSDGMEDTSRAYLLAKRGVEEYGGEIDKTAEKFLQFKRIFGTELEDSGKAANNMSAAFKINLDESLDTITKTEQSLKRPVDDLYDTFWEFSVQFKDAGFTYKEMAQIIVNGINDGNAFNTTKIGDAIKEVGIGFADLQTKAEALQGVAEKAIPSWDEFYSEKMGDVQIKNAEDLFKIKEKEVELQKEYQKLVEDTNQSNQDAMQAALEYDDKVKDLQYLGIDPEQYVQTIRKGGESAKAAVIDLMTRLGNVTDDKMFRKIRTDFFTSAGEDLGHDFFRSFANFKNVEMNTSGSLDEAVKIYTDGNLLQTLRQTLAYIKDIGNSLGSGPAMALDLLAKGFNYLLMAVSWLLNSIPGLGPLIGILGTLASLVMLIGGASMALGGAWTFLSGLWSAGIAVLNGVRVAMLALNLTMLANPVFLITAGIVALVAIIAVVVEKTVGWRNVWSGISNFFKNVFTVAINLVKGAINGLIYFFTDLLPKSILRFIDFVTAPLKYFYDLILAPVRMLGKLVGFNIPKFSDYSLYGMVYGNNGGGNKTTNITINANQLDMANADRIGRSIARQTAQ
ncbi:phage tail tape measure protein [Brevibacillus brevis]|uniref:phage tail tape measure protein n=1 Tax=Brevibacillus brevis TaxID=1393 RepID=UPI000D112C65|nr:phage tail tape measure protein [Brevibacillus brevis]PSJ67444.1 hypothetical protein C7J99_20855 [Brevibacillus brevis]RED28430.1 phage-related minor tail protein [Brevibacillus brevis]GEC90684.1 hypothetical protein BBR01nite_30150 [Brevibacillus brevis]VEF91125.1 Phage-related minor tail protein [Brevibacillus brevis]